MADEIVKDDTKTIVNDDNKDASDDDKKSSQKDSEDKKESQTDDNATDLDDDKGDNDQIADSEDSIQSILDKHGYDSLDELEEDFGSLKELQDLIGKRDAKQLIEDSEYLAKVKEYWEQQEEEKKRQDESFEETIERQEREKKELEQKLKDRDSKAAKEKEQREAKANADKLIKSFDSTVTGEIDKIKDLPKEYKPFLREYLGVGNPANEIDIALKPEVRSMAREGIKKFQEFEQAVIKRYLDGKIETPKITSDSTETPVNKEKKPQNMEDARTMLYETFGVKQ